MSEGTDGEESFLNRWSARKRRSLHSGSVARNKAADDSTAAHEASSHQAAVKREPTLTGLVDTAQDASDLPAATPLDEELRTGAKRYSPAEAVVDPDADPDADPGASNADSDLLLTDADMPPIESLTSDSDVSAFFNKGVSAALRRAALRHVFHQPKFNVRDGLNDYDGDYTVFEPLGDTITSDMKWHTARKERERLEAEARQKELLEADEDEVMETDDSDHQESESDQQRLAESADTTEPESDKPETDGPALAPVEPCQSDDNADHEATQHSVKKQTDSVAGQRTSIEWLPVTAGDEYGEMPEESVAHHDTHRDNVKAIDDRKEPD